MRESKEDVRRAERARWAGNGRGREDDVPHGDPLKNPIPHCGEAWHDLECRGCGVRLYGREDLPCLRRGEVK